MEIKNKKAYKIWRKMMDFALPLFWLWVFFFAPNLHKQNSKQEMLKSLVFLLCLGVFVMIPLFFVQKKFMEKLVRNQTNNNLANYKFNETIPTKTGLLIIGSIIVGIVGFVVLINLATLVSKWLIQLLF